MVTSIFLLFSISGGEIILILFFVLIFFGAKGIPTMARMLGRGIRQFKDATQDIQRDILDSANDIKDNLPGSDKDK